MDIADILIDVHPELSANQRMQVEEKLRACSGVVSAHFSPNHPHELVVAYDPRAITSQQILALVRNWDNAATMAGL